MSAVRSQAVSIRSAIWGRRDVITAARPPSERTSAKASCAPGVGKIRFAPGPRNVARNSDTASSNRGSGTHLANCRRRGRPMLLTKSCRSMETLRTSLIRAAAASVARLVSTRVRSRSKPIFGVVAAGGGTGGGGGQRQPGRGIVGSGGGFGGHVERLARDAEDLEAAGGLEARVAEPAAQSIRRMHLRTRTEVDEQAEEVRGGRHAGAGIGERVHYREQAPRLYRLGGPAEEVRDLLLRQVVHEVEADHGVVPGA